MKPIESVDRGPAAHHHIPTRRVRPRAAAGTTRTATPGTTVLRQPATPTAAVGGTTRPSAAGPGGSPRRAVRLRSGVPFARRAAGGRRGAGTVGPAAATSARALLLLLAEEPMHGYQLMQAVAERTGGGWKLSPRAPSTRPSPSSRTRAWSSVTAEGGRKLVTLTDAGREHVESLGDVDPFAAFAAGDGDDASTCAALHRRAAWAPPHQLGRVGDAAQLAAAAQVLTDARRALYLILAGEAGRSSRRPAPRETPA